MRHILALFVCALLTVSLAHAATPTASQLEQFKKLPRAQQEQLARQYGVDLDRWIDSATSNNQQPAPSVVPSRPERIGGSQAFLERALQQENTPSKTLEPFGYAFFDGEPTPMVAVHDLPLPNDYRVGPGDVLDIQVFGKENQAYQLKVKRDGYIHFPEYGPMQVADETFSKVREQIRTMFAERVIGVDVTVDISAMRTMQIYLAGEVKQPGAFTVSGLTTMTQALIASGGVKKTGSLRYIQLKRNGKVINTLDLYALLLNGDARNDVRLLKGDTLFVPTRGAQVKVDGEVLRPALYELKEKTSLIDILTMAGGSLPEGYLSSVSVKRVTESGVQPFSVDMRTPKGQAFTVKNGDAIHIAKSNEAFDNAVVVRGEVVRQGAYNFEPGMTVADVIKNRRDLKPSADLNYALVVREIDAERNIDVLQFKLGTALEQPSSSENLRLHKGDQIFVFNNGIDSQFWDETEIDQSESKNAQQNQMLSQQVTRIPLTANIPLSDTYTQQTKNQQSDTTTQQIRYAQQPEGGAPRVFIDPATGAEVQVQNVQNQTQLIKALTQNDEEGQPSHREQELKPIIERLKDQANIESNAAIVEVSGAVKYPGIYPLPTNATFQQLIEAAGGLTEAAYLGQAEITRRQVVDGRLTVRHYPVNVEKALNGEYQQFKINRQDRINIKTKPNWHKDNVIELQGEVRFPGVYAFERGETLKDVIERAGGLTEFAYPKGAVFSRERLKRQEEERLKMLNRQLKQEISSLALRRQTSSAQYTTSPSEALSIAEELQNAEAVGRMVISLPRALQGDDVANIMVESGDKLYVPPKNPVVSIMGEVQFTSNQLFEPSMTVSDYIESAGGTKQQADTDRIYVVRADGSVMMPNNSFWFSRNQKQLEPGDTIIVPIDTDYLDGLSTASTATQILYQMGIAWKAVND
ncbi:SLBB domain-containing protein [Salinivibrio proteolyticus]|uniref:SLBB domain-containing protein n=1 Tax=Salinivibrio proteolyticus TaxID=334715 RepID=UPI0009C55190|nr:SLBB domain-containing protein [Salinivibrio proteolyticus]OOF31725.1 sugar transporter [Salinivibrio proteolyticus]